MKSYTVYFEIFGKKMKTTVTAASEKVAKDMVKEKIIFHKIEGSQKENIDIPDIFKDIFGGFGVK